MSLKDFYRLIKGLGYPLAYHHFEEGRVLGPPYLLYWVSGSENKGADNMAYHKQEEVLLEVYTKIKNLDLEGQVEALLDTHRIYFDKVETYLTTEKLYQVTYHITL
ncbi:hypothetical protein [Streptococcus suis]